MTPEPVALVEGRLYALAHPYELDGRASSHPPEMRGYATINSYLLLEGNRATLIDTGMSIHEDALIAQLEALLPPDAELTVWLMRIGEFPSLCNARPIIERFKAEAVYGTFDDSLLWADFRPEHVPAGSAAGSGALEGVESRLIGAGAVVPAGPDGTRELFILNAPLRLLPTIWIYDADTKTLFTSDCFNYGILENESDRPVVDRVEDVDREALHEQLVGGRNWWLPGAQTASIRDQIAATFAERDVARLAPGFGSIYEGRDVVEHVVATLLEEMESIEQLEPIVEATPRVG